MKEATLKLSSDKFSKAQEKGSFWAEKSMGKGTGRKDVGLLPA